MFVHFFENYQHFKIGVIIVQTKNDQRKKYNVVSI